MTRPATIDIDRMKAYEWLKNGAQPTETVNAILRFKGVLYYKHLQRGVAKGSFTPEEAEIKFRAWVDQKESSIAARVNAAAEERKARASQISGTVKKAEKKKERAEVQDELLNVNLESTAPPAKEVENTGSTENEKVTAPEEKTEAVENTAEVSPETSEETES
jgi:small subunit ribosomal protein S16